VTDFSVLSEPADKTPPPVLSGEIPFSQKQNEYHSEKLAVGIDLIGQRKVVIPTSL